jgi:hypothetical protein
MFSFTDDERAYLSEMRAMSTDASGNEILVGLTLEETAFYMNYTRKRLTGEHDHQHGERYLELHDKHEQARLEVLGTEIHLRTEKTTFH